MTALENRPTTTVDRCDHCGSEHMSLALDASPWALMRCADCDFVFTSPRLTDEALSHIYSDEYYENAEIYAAQQVELPSEDHFALARRARAFLKRDNSELSSMDVGCGGGRLVEAFSTTGFVASGVEPSAGTVRAAQAAGRNISAADISELSDDGYDCVTAMHVLEHVISPTEFTAQLYRITKPGGLCIVEVPNFGSKAAKELGADWYALHPSTHLSHFTPTSLENCIRKAGFNMKSLHRLGGAGLFADVSEATARKTTSHTATAFKRAALANKTLGLMWRARSAVTTIPAARRLVRWVNWELLGQGEFVRVFAVKPR